MKTLHKVAVVLALLLSFLAALFAGSVVVSTSSTTSSLSSSLSTSLSSSISSVCVSVGGLPDPHCTPGALNANVTQATIQTTICVSGYTLTIRPPTSYTNPLKVQSIRDYGYRDKNLSNYEEDHLISLELGGSPRSVLNLWAEPHMGVHNALQKDRFENYLHRQICSGGITLVEAQKEISTDWVRYWLAAGSP